MQDNKSTAPAHVNKNFEDAYNQMYKRIKVKDLSQRGEDFLQEAAIKWHTKFEKGELTNTSVGGICRALKLFHKDVVYAYWDRKRNRANAKCVGGDFLDTAHYETPEVQLQYKQFAAQFAKFVEALPPGRRRHFLTILEEGTIIGATNVLGVSYQSVKTDLRLASEVARRVMQMPDMVRLRHPAVVSLSQIDKN